MKEAFAVKKIGFATLRQLQGQVEVGLDVPHPVLH
jgi:hypothetical protein